MDDVSFHSVAVSRPPFAALLFLLSSLSQTGIRLRGGHAAQPGPGNREMDVFPVGGGCTKQALPHTRTAGCFYFGDPPGLSFLQEGIAVSSR